MYWAGRSAILEGSLTVRSPFSISAPKSIARLGSRNPRRLQVFREADTRGSGPASRWRSIARVLISRVSTPVMGAPPSTSRSLGDAILARPSASPGNLGVTGTLDGGVRADHAIDPAACCAGLLRIRSRELGRCAHIQGFAVDLDGALLGIVNP